MENFDTVIEVHRERVEVQAREVYSGGSYEREFNGDYTERGTATLNFALGRVWFFLDSHARLWQEEAAGQASEPKRHFAFDLAMADSEVVIESIGGVPLVPLPATTVTIPDGPRAGESREIPSNVIPLLGRLTLHEQVARWVLPSGNETIALNFNPEDAPLLVATPPPDQFVSHLFAARPGIERRADGSTAFGGQDPRVVWDIDYAEAFWITHSRVGELLVTREKLLRPGSTDAEARRRVLDAIAARIGVEVRDVAKGLGTGGIVDLLGKKSEGLEVDPASSDGIRELDVAVQRFQVGGNTHESMIIQLRTTEALPAGWKLPTSILAENPAEQVALAQAGFAILRGVRSTVMRSFCLDESDFVPNAPCLLKGAKSVEVGGDSRSLDTFNATIEPGSDRERGRLVVDGKVSDSAWWMEFNATFRITYEMDLDDIPREADEGEAGTSSGETMGQLGDRLRDAAAKKCRGDISADEYEAEANRVKELLKELPRTVGIAPTLRPPKPSVDSFFSLTTAGLAAFALGVAIAIVIPASAVALAGGLTLGALMGLIIAGIPAYFALVIDVEWLGTGLVRGKIERALRGRPGGSPLLETLGVPIDVQLGRYLAVYFRPMPPRLDVSCIKKDTAEDVDEVIQIIGGRWPTDGKRWKISENDAVIMIDSGKLELFVDAEATGGTALPIHVATNSHGRRYLRSNPDEGVADILATLPECPVPSDVRVGLRIEPSTITFGSVAVGSTASRAVRIKNATGGSVVVRLPASPPGVFEWAAVDTEIPDGEETTIQVLFRPVDNAIRTELVRITSTAPGSPHTFGLVGKGPGGFPFPSPEPRLPTRLTFAPSVLSFGSVAIGAERTLQLRIGNETGRSVQISIAPSAPGSVFRWSAVETSLATGAELRVSITFSAASNAIMRGTLLVTSTTASSPESIGLLGKGPGGFPTPAEG